MKKSVAVKVALLAFLIAFGTGCTTVDWVDRSRDAKDVVNLCIGYGAGAKARVGPLHAGAVFHIEQGGLRGGTIHWAKERWDHHVEIHLLLIGHDDFIRSSHSPGPRRKGYLTTHSIITLPGVYGTVQSEGASGIEHFAAKGGEFNQIYSTAYYTQIDCIIGLGPSFRVGLNPGEFLDLLLGFWGVDIYDDDLDRLKQKAVFIEKTHD